MFWTQPDDPAPGIDAVAHSLLRALDLLLCWDGEADTVDWIEASLPGTRHPTPPPYGLTPQRGWIGQHPVYCALWCQPASESLDGPGRVAQAILIAAGLELSRSHRDLTAYASALQTAGLAVRHLLQGGIDPTHLDDLNNIRSLDDADRILTVLFTMKLVERDRQRIRGLLTLISYACTDRVPRAGYSITRIAQVTRKTLQEIDTPFPSYAEVEESRPLRLDDTGGAPVQESPGRRIAYVHLPDQAIASPAVTLRQQFFRAQVAARAIQSKAQGLLAASDRLQLVDLSALHSATQLVLEGKNAEANLHEAGLVLLSLSLLLGLPAEALSGIRIGKVHEDGQYSRTRLIHLNQRHYVLPVASLPGGFTPAPIDQHHYRAVESHLVLDLPELALTQLLRHWFPRLKQLLTSEHPDKTMGQACSWINGRYNARLTLPRVATFLYRQVYTMTGDWADAAFFAPATANRTGARRYYYAPSRLHLSNCYTDVWEGFCKGIGSTWSVPRAERPRYTGYVGTEGCPRQDRVRDMVTRQISICRDALRGRRNRSRIRTGHNALALYTWLMAMWMSGARAVDDAIDLQAYDPDSGLLQLSDKDTDEYYASRIAWLPRVAQDQIEAYLANVDRCAEILQSPLPQTLFFLAKDNDQPIPLTLSEVQKRLTHDYPFRLSAQRHFLRTRLREERAPAECVDALMGHGLSGQEPYSGHSVYSGRQLVNELQGPLTKIARDSGWKVVPRT